jgi:spoIIIJ-associated protein
VSEGADDLVVEAAGETVGEARWAALHQLEARFPGLDRAAVTYTVLAEGRRGLLGVGYEPARVIARLLEAPPPAATSEARLRELVDRVLAGLGLEDRRVRIEHEDDALVARVLGPDLGILIGKHGATIDAVQYLANAIMHRGDPDPPPVVIDAQGYRERRARTLGEVALRAAEEARRTGAAVALEPMVAGERKVVHLRLKDVPDVRTESEGQEPNRHVVVLPAPPE